MVNNRAWQQIIWIVPKKNSESCSDDWHLWRFWAAFKRFGTHFADSFRMFKSSWMMDPTHSCEMLCFSAIELAEIPPSSRISSRNYLRGCRCFVSSRTRRSTGGNITTFKLGHPVFEGGIWRCMFLSEWREFPLSNDIIDSVLRHRELGRVKDLSAPSRVYQRYMQMDFHILFQNINKNENNFEDLLLWNVTLFQLHSQTWL
jgi:hypothetical protein